MITCPICSHSENENDQDFCNNCGAALEGNKDTVINSDTPNDTDNSQGKLVFPDESSYEIDYSQRLIGRADLEKFTKEDYNLIPRSQFTIYKSNEKYFIRNGFTNVQNTSSQKDTLLNEEKISSDELEIKNGDKIKISDVELLFIV